ncbi:MAG: Crp/Fnr family transcriptional regulator [Chitinophagales bacterium]
MKISKKCFPSQKIISLKKEDYFIRTGEYKPIIALVISGIIRGVYYTDNGQEMTPFFWPEHQAVASWETIYLQQPSALDYEAIEDTTLAVIDFIAFKKLAAQNSKLQQAYIEMVEIIFANTLIHQQEYINAKPKKRYELFQKNSNQIINRIADKHIASHLGITPISFSRMKKRLEE